MFETRQGNIFDAQVEAIVNPVNCVGVMGKGLALQFKKRYPDNFEAYKRACKAEQVRPGEMFIFMREERPTHIINFPTKRHWRAKSRLEDVESGLFALVKEVRGLGLRSIAIPPLGCGLGGLDWDVVGPMIEASFLPLDDVDVYLYAPKT